MDLADARLGEAKNLGDFAQVQILAVVKGEDFALDFGELLEALVNHLLKLGLGNFFEGAGFVGIGHDIIEAARIVALGGTHGIEAEELRGADFIEEIVIFVEGNLHGGGHLFIARDAAEALFEGVHDILDFSGFFVDSAGHPIHFAKFIEHGAADAKARVGFKGGAGGGIVIAEGLRRPMRPALCRSSRSTWSGRVMASRPTA